MKKQAIKRVGVAIAASTIALAAAGCGAKTQVDEEANVKQEQVEANVQEDENINIEQAKDFIGNSQERTVKLLSEVANTKSDKNTMISSTSVDMALALVANAANDEAKAAIEKYLGASLDEINTNNRAYLDMKQADPVLKIANSLWVSNQCKDLINPEVSAALKNVYSSNIGVYDTTPDIINQWVSEKTNGMIPSILDQIDTSMKSMLINSICFEGKWVVPYEETQVWAEIFSTREGNEVNTNFMHSTEEIYMENEQAIGFEKQYEDGYSFVGILPKDEKNMDIASLKLDELLAFKTYEYDVNVSMPKFEYETDLNLRKTLSMLGLTEIFEEGSLNPLLVDYEDSLSIDSIIHKTFIRVDEKGTEAAAVTGVTVKNASVEAPKQVKEVNLNRPFIYCIVDNSTEEVIFMGVVNSVESIEESTGE